LFIDAYHTQIKDEEVNRIKKSVVYNIVGIDMEGRKSLVSYYIYFGSESKEDWLQILNDLIKRGLKRVMVIVSDDFPGRHLSRELCLFIKFFHENLLQFI
jgi:transposase-like protein